VPAREPEQVDYLLAEAFNAQDLDACAAIYDPEASVVRLEIFGGTIAEGDQGIREIMADYVGLAPRMDVAIHHVTRAGDYDLLALKSALDFIAALTFASVLGWGVLLSAGAVLVVQGALTLGAGFIEPVVTDPMISAATATGGVLIFGLGLMLLELKEVRVANMLPALLFAPLLVAAAPLWPF
jgi:Protein of unknown function (DUF554)/SnoaL-like domain